MKRAAIAILAGLLCIGSPTVQADSPNPFGFETNTHPLEYEYCKKEPSLVKGLYGYRCSSAPRPHPELEDYFLFFVEDVGLCSIWTRNLDLEPQPVVESFKEQIAKKYGAPTRKTDNLLNSPGFEKGTYGYDWTPEAGFKGLGDVKAIKLEFSNIPESRWPLTPGEPRVELKSHETTEADKLYNKYRALAPRVHVLFWLVTFDACLKKIDDIAHRSF